MATYLSAAALEKGYRKGKNAVPVLRGVDATYGDQVAHVAAGRDPSSGYTPEEEDAVRRRLEDLGYL